MAQDLLRMPAWRGAEEIAAGRLKAEAWVRALLEHTQAREPELRAWACLDAERALTWARESDAWTPCSPLHGVPIGIKDIIIMPILIQIQSRRGGHRQDLTRLWIHDND